MITIIKTVYTYICDNIKSNANKNQLIEELQKLNIPRSDDLEEREINVQTENDYINNRKCIKNTGIITSLESSHGMINNNLLFYKSAIPKDFSNLTIGSKISYLAVKESDYVSPKIIKMEHIIEDWNESGNAQINNETRDSNNYIQNTINEMNKNKDVCCDTVIHTILGIIKERIKNIIVLDTDYDNVDADLNTVEIQFVPMIGDRVYVTCCCECDLEYVDSVGQILSVISIQPCCSKTDNGVITKLNTKEGVIDNIYFFNYNSLELNYIPQIYDKVTFEAIESDVMQYKWRCLKVVFINNKSLVLSNNNIKSDHNILYKNKNGIIIEDNLKFKFNEINSKSLINIVIENTNKELYYLTSVNTNITKSKSQITLLLNIKDSVIINPGEILKFPIELNSKYHGQNYEIIEFHFNNNFSIRRNIEIILIDNISIYSTENQLQSYDNKTSKKYNDYKRTNKIWDKDYSMVIKGERINQEKIFFKKINFNKNLVPSDLRTHILNNYHNYTPIINKYLPFLNDNLCYENYISVFKNLLYIEEIEHFHNLRCYDRDRIHFEKKNNSLVLTIENLSEKRPSVIIGDSVLASNLIDESLTYQGIIHKILKDCIYINFNRKFYNEYNGEDYNVVFQFSRGNLLKQHYAVEESLKKINRNTLFPVKLNDNNVQLNVELNNENLILNHTIKLEWFNQNLNIRQKEAVRNILRGECRPLPYIIYGPPGTGKTITLIEIIIQIIKNIPHSRILVGTPSNSAANLITELILNSKALNNFELVRLIGHNYLQSEKIPEHLLKYCAVCDLSKDGTSNDNMVVTDSGLRLKCQTKHLGHHRVIIGTCITLGSLLQMNYKENHFTHFISDEAGQNLECDTLIPMILLNKNKGQTVLVGDPMQLGPVVMSQIARNYGLDRSLLVRLLERGIYKQDDERFGDMLYNPKLITKLIYNYRALPSILKLYSDLFYSSQLIPMINETTSFEITLLKKLKENYLNKKFNANNNNNFAIYFHGVNGSNMQTIDSPSWYNPVEAKLVYLNILHLLKLNILIKDIGIITPYQLQAKIIKNMLLQLNLNELPKIGTTEEFQGLEKQIILISTVRSAFSTDQHNYNNYSNILNFIKCPRRINVSLSRARTLLIIFGNPFTLATNAQFKHVINECVINDTYSGCPLPENFV